MHDYDVVTMGSATVDLFAATDAELVQIQTRHSMERLLAYPLGGKILIRELDTAIGGGGTNTAVAFARLGLRTAFLGKVGSDPQGEQVMAALAAEHIDFIGARGGQTGLSMILDAIGQDRTILAYKGANDQLRLEDITLPRCRWLYCSAMLGDSLETQQQLVRQIDAKVAFNPSSYLAQRGAEALKPMLEHTSALILNKEESCELLGLPEHESRPLAELARTLSQQLAIPVVAVTDGAHGVAATDGHSLVTAQPGPNLSIVETTGAGDAFASAFVAMLCQEQPLARAVRAGMFNSESVLAYRGAKNRLLTAPELTSRLEADRRPLQEQPY